MKYEMKYEMYERVAQERVRAMSKTERRALKYYLENRKEKSELELIMLDYLRLACEERA